MGISEHASGQASENPIHSLADCMDDLANIYYYLIRRNIAPSDYRTKMRLNMAQISVRASYDIIAAKLQELKDVGMEVENGNH